jgi:hypothetical protein
LHVKTLPYQSFPGIFSTIDRYNKLIVQGYFDRTRSLPSWLGQLGEVESYVHPPHWSKFKVLGEETGVTLRGEADGIFKMADGSYAIVDYKTAKYTPGQMGLYKSYEVQLNAYAFIGNRLDLAPVGQLALVYMEPATDEQTAKKPHLVDDLGFSMGLTATVVPVDVRPDALVPPLLREARNISEMDSPPPPRARVQGVRGCRHPGPGAPLSQLPLRSATAEGQVLGSVGARLPVQLTVPQAEDAPAPGTAWQTPVTPGQWYTPRNRPWGRRFGYAVATGRALPPPMLLSGHRLMGNA